MNNREERTRRFDELCQQEEETRYLHCIRAHDERSENDRLTLSQLFRTPDRHGSSIASRERMRSSSLDPFGYTPSIDHYIDHDTLDDDDLFFTDLQFPRSASCKIISEDEPTPAIEDQDYDRKMPAHEEGEDEASVATSVDDWRVDGIVRGGTPTSETPTIVRSAPDSRQAPISGGGGKRINKQQPKRRRRPNRRYHRRRKVEKKYTVKQPKPDEQASA